MAGTKSQPHKPAVRISGETLKNKKAEFQDNIKKADIYVKSYRAMFRKIKNFDNHKWKKMISQRQDGALSDLIAGHRTKILEVGRLLEKLMTERKEL